MIEKKTFGHRAVNVLFGCILILAALSCLLPLLYNLAVSLSSKAAAEAGLVSFWPVDFMLNAYQEIMGEKSFFVSFGVAVKRVVLALAITLPVLTWRPIRWRRAGRNSRRETGFCGCSCSACCFPEAPSPGTW